MQVILLERIGKLGDMGDVVTVKDGYARNFLLPKGKALRATKPNMERFEHDRDQLEARNAEQKGQASSVAGDLDGQSFVVIRQAGDTGQLYGSVSTRDVAETISNSGMAVTRQQVLLDRPIKILGLHDVRVALHPEVEVSVTINVARSEDEAVRQARGEDVTAMEDELEEADAASAEEVFEDQELAREAQAELQEETEQEIAAAQAPSEGDGSAAGSERKESDGTPG